MATIFNRVWRALKGSNRSGMVHLTGSMTITTDGAIGSSDTPGFTITKTATKTGRFRVQITSASGDSASPAVVKSGSTVVAPFGIQAPSFAIASPVADNALTTDVATKWSLRNLTPGSGYFDVQFYKDITSTTTETHADCELESGSVVLISFWVKTSSVVP